MQSCRTAFAISILSLFLGRFAQAEDFQVLVNPSVEENSISRDDLKHILMANQMTWKNGSKILIIALNPDNKMADKITLNYMAMTAIQARKYWLTKVFGGTLEAPPLAVDTPEAAVEKVQTTNGAITIVPAGTKPGKSKSLELK